MGSGNQSGSITNAFGAFGPLFQTYTASLDQVARAFGAPTALTADFSPASLSERAGAPLKAAARGQLELLGFVNRRAQAYMQVPARIAHCRSPQDVFNEQIAFWRTATEQYAETSRRIFEAWTQLDPLQATDGRTPERDYINFNGTGGNEGLVPTPLPEQVASNKQRRVA